jgi:CCR4-NOT transcription complex subunit 1
MPKLLLSENRKVCLFDNSLPYTLKNSLGMVCFHKLLLSLFKFLHPLLKDADLQTAGRDLYRGTLRLLLVLLYDFPEFMSEYFFSLCDAIPQRCIQLRNNILSAFPPAIVLPDPNLRNVKFEAIPKMGPIPPFIPDFASSLKSGDLKVYLDQYLLNRGSSSFLPSFKDRLKLQGNDAEEVYNLSLINSWSILWSCT